MWDGKATTHLVVDEIQDFTPEEVRDFKTKSDYLHFFGDSFQQIYAQFRQTTNFEELENILENERRKTLKFNYRLPKNIAKVAVCTRHWQGTIRDAKQNGEEFVENCQNEGESFAFEKSFNHGQEELEKNFIAELVQAESKTRQVAIILPFNKDVKALYQFLEKKGVECEVKYSETEDKTFNTLDFRTSNIKLLTWHSSKGLQFECVILPFMNSRICRSNWIEALFVALSRSSNRMFVTYSGPRTIFLSQANQDILKKYGG
jgi:superfamily I DNA/RNA helicase